MKHSYVLDGNEAARLNRALVREERIGFVEPADTERGFAPHEERSRGAAEAQGGVQKTHTRRGVLASKPSAALSKTVAVAVQTWTRCSRIRQCTKKKPRRVKPVGVDGGLDALAVGFGGERWMSLQPGSNRLLPWGPAIE